MDVKTIEDHVPRVKRLKCIEAPQECALARPRGANEYPDFALCEIKGHVIESDNLLARRAIDLREVSDL
jgi:hypothetical protein